MKFEALLSDFQKVLQKVIPAVPPKSTLPVLEHLKFELTGTTLKIIATDQDISIMSNLEVNSEKDGSVLVPARKLNDIIKALDTKSNFTFSSDEENFDIKLTTETGHYSMKGLDPEEYLYLPELFESVKPNLDLDPESNKFVSVFEPGILQRLANKTAFSISSDEYRLSMTGALFQFRNGYVNVVATDSFRLIRAKAKSDKFQFSEDFDVLIPARMMEFLKKVDEQAIMSMLDSMGRITHVRVDYGSTILISRVIDEKFPPYESVIPSDVKATVIIDPKQLISTLRRVALFANQLSKQVRFTFADNYVYLYAEEENNTTGDDKVPCEYIGDKIEIAFNFKNLDEILSNIDSNETDDNSVEIQFFEQGKPVLIMPRKEEELLLSLIMPVRV